MPLMQLRQCLSVALNCDAMRISKKFAGPYSIGKQVFTPLDKGHANYAVLTAVAADELNIGRTSWFRKLDEIENQALSRSRKKMRLETKGTTAALIYSDHHTILRDKSETADLESFQSAIMSLHSMKQVHSSDRSASEHVRYPIQAANEDKLPSVVSAIEKILRGEFAQQAPVAHMTMAPMWVTQAPAPGYSPFMQQHSQEMQQHIMQQHMVQMQHPHMPQQYIQTGQTHPTETRNNDIPKFE